MTNEINTLSDAAKVLAKKTEQLLDKYDAGEKINTTQEKSISKRFDTIARQHSQMIALRKDGVKDFDIFLK